MLAIRQKFLNSFILGVFNHFACTSLFGNHSVVEEKYSVGNF